MYEDITKEIRKDIMVTALKGKAGHLASALSMAEIVTALYFGEVLQYDKDNPNWEGRDKVILSKGHASLALYSALYRIGYLTKEQLHGFCQEGSLLGGEPKRGDIPGVEATTGSLGHGLSFAVGIAMAEKYKKTLNRIYVIQGDGECQEGSVWEAALSAAHHKLGNLTVILDRNQLQAMGDTEEIVGIESLKEKWESFGFLVTEVDGHDTERLIAVLQKDKRDKTERPRIIIAHTVKGKGISFMENVPIWHYRMPNAEEQIIANQELGITKEDLL
ncbi:transketolase [Lachnospiraceae bacterium XBB1006]|nr:transketolase [Lachnospiraceae bacterium XBB1006]